MWRYLRKQGDKENSKGNVVAWVGQVRGKGQAQTDLASPVTSATYTWPTTWNAHDVPFTNSLGTREPCIRKQRRVIGLRLYDLKRAPMQVLIGRIRNRCHDSTAYDGNCIVARLDPKSTSWVEAEQRLTVATWRPMECWCAGQRYWASGVSGLHVLLLVI